MPALANSVLAGALLWLRNHYDVGHPSQKANVIATVDRMLEEIDINGSDQRAFQEWLKNAHTS